MLTKSLLWILIRYDPIVISICLNLILKRNLFTKYIYFCLYLYLFPLTWVDDMDFVGHVVVFLDGLVQIERAQVVFVHVEVDNSQVCCSTWPPDTAPSPTQTEPVAVPS